MVVGQDAPVLAARVPLSVVVLCAGPHIEPVLLYHVVAEVPLAHVAAHVLLGHHLREDGHVRRQRQLVHDRTGRMRVQTGHDRGAGRRADGLGNVGVLEDVAGGGEGVEIRGLGPAASVAPHGIPALLVAHDEDKVASGHNALLLCQIGGILLAPRNPVKDDRPGLSGCDQPTLRRSYLVYLRRKSRLTALNSSGFSRL